MSASLDKAIIGGLTKSQYRDNGFSGSTSPGSAESITWLSRRYRKNSHFFKALS
ncbi:MAG: hypothetical protein ACLSEY_00260 [Enterocloster sp.]